MVLIGEPMCCDILVLFSNPLSHLRNHQLEENEWYGTHRKSRQFQ